MACTHLPVVNKAARGRSHLFVLVLQLVQLATPILILLLLELRKLFGCLLEGYSASA